MYYFAYGSNLDQEQLRGRIGDVNIIGKAVLHEHTIKFNKQSRDGSGKANIVNQDTSDVEGVIFNFTEEQFKKMDKSEVGYHRKQVSLAFEDRQVKAITYAADSEKINDTLTPTKEYLQIIIGGAKNFELSDAYQKMLATFSI
jgi:gamma-glutamylcyclotransferase (GGCT)/AIG2-like uncharacterized protein YtfP